MNLYACERRRSAPKTVSVCSPGEETAKAFPTGAPSRSAYPPTTEIPTGLSGTGADGIGPFIFIQNVPRILGLFVVDGNTPVDKFRIIHFTVGIGVNQTILAGDRAGVEEVAGTVGGDTVVVALVLGVAKTPSVVLKNDVTFGEVDLLGVGDRDETVDEGVGSEIGGNVEGEVAAAGDGDGGTSGSGLHALGIVVTIDGDLQVLVVTGGQCDKEVVAVGDVLRGGANESGGGGAVGAVGKGGFFTAVVDVESTVDGGLGSDFDFVDADILLLEVDLQSTAEVFEGEVLIGGGGNHGEVGHEVAVLGLLEGRKSDVAGAVGQGSGIDSGYLIAHVGDGSTQTAQLGGTGVAPPRGWRRNGREQDRKS